jgi:cell division protein FtsB
MSYLSPYPLAHYYIFLTFAAMSESSSNRFVRLFRNAYNKYVIVGLLFLVWIAFFDKNSYVEKAQLRSKISTLGKEKRYYLRKIEEDGRKMQELLSSRDNLEKFAREQYLMKNKNEDIFIIVEE